MREESESTKMTNPVRKPLRIWPGVVIVILQLLLHFGHTYRGAGCLALWVARRRRGRVAVILWWLFFSRAAWSERLGALGLMIVAMFATKHIVDVSIATGAQGYLFYFLAIPWLGPAFVAWAVITRRLPDVSPARVDGRHHPAGVGGWAMVRTGGFTASRFCITTCIGGGRRLPRNGFWRNPATRRARFRRCRQPRRLPRNRPWPKP